MSGRPEAVAGAVRVAVPVIGLGAVAGRERVDGAAAGGPENAVRRPVRRDRERAAVGDVTAPGEDGIWVELGHPGVVAERADIEAAGPDVGVLIGPRIPADRVLPDVVVSADAVDAVEDIVWPAGREVAHTGGVDQERGPELRAAGEESIGTGDDQEAAVAKVEVGVAVAGLVPGREVVEHAERRAQLEDGHAIAGATSVDIEGAVAGGRIDVAAAVSHE